MTRKLKVLGLAFGAVLAMSAISGAASAQAAVPSVECTSTTNTCTVTATEINTHTFTVQRGNVRCRSSLHATLNAKKVNSVTGVRATYTGCRAFGVAAEVRMGTCTYTLTGVEDLDRTPHTANVTVVCPSGNILVEAPSLPCTINVGGQGPKPHIIFTNQGEEPTHIRANITVSGLTYTTAGVGCPGGSAGTFNDGSYAGESTLEGFNDLGPESNTDGNKVGLHVVT